MSQQIILQINTTNKEYDAIGINKEDFEKISVKKRRYFMAKYFMGIDAGTGSVRVAIFDEKGHMTAYM